MATTDYTLDDASNDLADLRTSMTVMGEAITMSDVTDPPTNPSSGAILYSSSGDIKYAGSDGSDYNVGRATYYSTSAQTISSTGGILVSPMSHGVGIGAYRVHVVCSYLENQSAGVPSFALTGPTTSTCEILTTVTQVAGGQPVLGNRTIVISTFFTSNTMTGITRILNLEALIVFTAAGTLQFQALTSAGADTFNIQAGSFMDVMPVS